MSGLTISMVPCATDIKTRDVGIQELLNAICNGGVRVKPLVSKIRQTIRRELDKHGDYKKAKQAAGELKKQLSASCGLARSRSAPTIS
jgi:hypothetical protein